MTTRFNPEHRIITGWVAEGSAVLDLGCGEGDLLHKLIIEKKVRGQGIEKNEQAIYKCVARGLNVSHGDIDSGLGDYNDASFDYVILNQSLQETLSPELVLFESFRVGKAVIVGFPNFASCRARFQLGIMGRAPVTASLPYRWFNSPNLHFLSIEDFRSYCAGKNIKIEKSAFLSGGRKLRFFPNLLAETGMFLIEGGKNQLPGK